MANVVQVFQDLHISPTTTKANKGVVQAGVLFPTDEPFVRIGGAVAVTGRVHQVWPRIEFRVEGASIA